MGATSAARAVLCFIAAAAMALVTQGRLAHAAKSAVKEVPFGVMRCELMAAAP